MLSTSEPLTPKLQTPPPPIFRSYRFPALLRIGILSAGMVPFAIALGIGLGAIPTAKDDRLGDFLIALFFGLLLQIAVWGVQAAKLTFTQDSVTLRTLFREKSLPLDAIRGRRERIDVIGKSRSHSWILVPEDDRLDELSFSRNYNFDESFNAWFQSLPDLDALDKKRTRDANFGLV